MYEIWEIIPYLLFTKTPVPLPFICPDEVQVKYLQLHDNYV